VWQHKDGESLLPLLRQSGNLSRDSLIWHMPGYLNGEQGTWRTTPGTALRHNEWKLLEFYEDGRLELYHLDTDPGERRNLAAEQPEVVMELHGLMRKWRDEVAAPVPSELNPAYDAKG